MFECKDCGANIELPSNVISSEIIGCQDCGLDYVIELDASGMILLMELSIEGEDWGE
jgi:lysine biosynthesis protein LysW